MKIFAERLKILRKERGLSQARLSASTGLSHTAIVNWENERRVPNGNAIVVLARFFGVTTDYLLGLED